MKSRRVSYELRCNKRKTRCELHVKGSGFGILPLIPLLLTGAKAKEALDVGKKIGTKLRSKRRRK